MNKKSNYPTDHPTARDPGEIGHGDDCRGISPEKPIPGPGIHKPGLTNFNTPVQEEFRLSPAKPELKWNSLADEEYRIYEWPDGSAIRLPNPSKLNVSKSGGHRVYTMDGISHYIPSGWNHLWWKVREGCPHFAF